MERKVLVPDFGSNVAYLSWEMGRIQERLRAYLKSHASGEPKAFLEAVLRQKEERAVVRQRRAALLEAGKPVPFEWLVRRHGLDPLEEDAVWLALAPHLSANTRSLLLQAQGIKGVSYLEVGFACELLLPAPDLVTRRHWVEAKARLVRHGLVCVEPVGRDVLGTRLGWSLEAPHHVAAAVRGELALDEALSPFASLERPSQELFGLIQTPETQAQIERFMAAFYKRRGHAQRAPVPWTLLVCGDGGTGKSTLVKCLARLGKSLLLTVHMDQIDDLQGAGRLLERAALNARFVHGVWHLSAPERLLAQRPQLAGLLVRLVREYPGLVVLETGDREALEQQLGFSVDCVVEMGRPEARHREQLWESLLPHDGQLEDPKCLTQMAVTYELTGGQIDRAVRWAVRRAESQGRAGRLKEVDLREGAWVQMRSTLGQLASISTVRLGMDDLVLPDGPMEQVRSLLAACRNRGRLMRDWGFGERLVTGKGLVSLFCGEAGTGKTLCAEILANELEMRLHIVNIPDIVSKWVGETEKNVREVFAQARAHNSMLLFDEADALFARRVKVERSQDHFQNMEVNNLLQEIERFDGVVVLTTNLEANMDPAFARRILYRIEFPAPEQAQRAVIWRKLIPPAAPINPDVDFEELAELYELTGGQIKNAIVRAAYRCLDADTDLTMKALEEAATDESAAAGRLIHRY